MVGDGLAEGDRLGGRRVGHLDGLLVTQLLAAVGAGDDGVEREQPVGDRRVGPHGGRAPGLEAREQRALGEEQTNTVEAAGMALVRPKR